MSQLFALPKELLLKTYYYLTPKELFTLSTSGDTRLKRIIAIEALFSQDSDEAIRWQHRLFELWAINPNDSIIISKKQILETINRPTSHRLFGSYYDNYHISLGLSLAGNRVIDGHSVRVEIQAPPADEEIAGFFEALECGDHDFYSALKRVEYLMVAHTPFMTNAQLEYCFNKIWTLLKQTNKHPTQSSVLSMFDKLAKHMPAHHFDDILNEFKEEGLINIPVLSRIAIRLNPIQWQTIIEILLNELENKKHPAPHKLFELIRIISLQRKITTLHLESLNNWVIEHLEDPDNSVRNRALIYLKLLANRMDTVQLNVLFERILEKLKGAPQPIDENILDQLEIVMPLIEPKKRILPVVQPLLNCLEYHSQSIKIKPFWRTHNTAAHYNKTLIVLSSISYLLTNEEIDRVLQLILIPRERRLDEREIKFIQSLSVIMTPEQRLFALSPLLNDPAKHYYQARDQAIQLLPLLGSQLTDADLKPVIDWALDNLETISYEVKNQIPLIVSVLASRISVEQLHPRLAQLLVTMQDEDPWAIRGAYQALETLGLYFNSKQLSPLLNWVVDGIQNQQDPKRNQAVHSLLPVFAKEMTPVELTPACSLFVEHLQNKNNYSFSDPTIQLIPVFINLMTPQQLMLTYDWLFTGINDTSDNNAQIIRQARMLLARCVNSMNEKQLLVTLNLFRNIETTVENNEVMSRLQINWFTVFGELAKRLDYASLLPVINWAAANLENESNQIRLTSTMILLRLGNQIEEEETGILVLNNLSRSHYTQEQLLSLIKVLFHPEAKQWKDSCDLLFKMLSNSAPHQADTSSISGAIRSWLLQNLHANFDNKDSYIESKHFDEVLAYLQQKCVDLKLQGVQNTDFLFMSDIIELCIRIKSSASAEYSNRNKVDIYRASSSNAPS